MVVPHPAFILRPPCCVTSVCDELAENILGLGSGKTFLTNERLIELIRPSNAGMPYLYENFNNWGEMELDLVGVHR